MYLSLGFPLRDLAERFNIHRTTAGRIISTWTHFLYCMLGSERLWVPPEIVRAHLPPEFAAFSDIQVVLDCSEVFSQTPSSLLLQSEVFSTYKSHTLQGHGVHGTPRCCHLRVWTVCRLHEGSRDLQAVRDCEAVEACYGDHGGQRICCGQPCSL